MAASALEHVQSGAHAWDWEAKTGQVGGKRLIIDSQSIACIYVDLFIRKEKVIV